jgi:hypothetical protein
LERHGGITVIRYFAALGNNELPIPFAGEYSDRTTESDAQTRETMSSHHMLSAIAAFSEVEFEIRLYWNKRFDRQSPLTEQ